MKELKVYVSYIHTLDLYMIQLFEVDENEEVLRYLEEYSTHNVRSAVNKVRDIKDRYDKVHIVSEDVGFNTHYMNE